MSLVLIIIIIRVPPHLDIAGTGISETRLGLLRLRSRLVKNINDIYLGTNPLTYMVQVMLSEILIL